jgi:transposase InsO family protein
MLFGPPAALLTDQGTHFQNKLLDEFAKLFGINKYCTTAYHPLSNGSIERMHHTLTEYLRKYVENETEWNTWVPICQHHILKSSNKIKIKKINSS